MKKDDFTYKIGWKCIDRIDAFEIGYNIAIRSEKVSEIYNMFSRVPFKYQRETSNLTLPFAYFTGEQLNESIQIIITSFTDMQEVIDSFSQIYNEKVKPFFYEYSSLEKLSFFMDNDIDNIYGDTFSNYMTSIILLKLTNSPSFSKKVEFYQNNLNDYSQWQQDDFKKTCQLFKINELNYGSGI